jgi:hypothetical protein
MSDKIKEALAAAEHASARAEETTNEKTRALYMQIAESWLRIADDRQYLLDRAAERDAESKPH